MKKISPVQLFVRAFVKSILVIVFLFGVGITSYKLTTMYYKATDKKVSKKTGEAIREIVNDVQIDRISKNLIYHYNTDTGEIEHLLLEIFNMDTSNLDYITIPANTQFPLSNELYQRIYANSKEIPQIVEMGKLGEYFKDEDTKYEYGCLFLEDLLGIDVSYYTVLENKYYNTLFSDESQEKGNKSQQEDGQEEEGQTMKQVFSDSFQTTIESLEDTETIQAYLEELYENVKSNLTIKNKLKYLDSYTKVKKEFIRFLFIPGTVNGNHYTIDTKEGAQLVADLEQNTAYTLSQEEEEALTGKGSMEKNIRILNGSNVTGLAASYQKLLKEEGYTISGIGNYTDFSQIRTKIIVKEEGIGKDLLKYFKNAQIEIGELPDTIEIEIILGREDGQ